MGWSLEAGPYSRRAQAGNRLARGAGSGHGFAVHGEFQRRVRPAIAELLTAFVAILLAELMVSGLVVVGVLPGMDPDDPTRWAWLLFGPTRTGLAAGLYLVLTKADERPVPALRKIALGPSVGWVAVYVVAATAGSVLIGELMDLFGAPPQEQTQIQVVVDQTLVGGPLMPAIALVVGATLLAPVCEELFFRGLLFRRLIPLVGLTGAFAVSSLAFSFIHGNLSGAPIYLWLGLCFAAVYVRTGRVGAAVFAHVVNNAFALILLFLRI